MRTVKTKLLKTQGGEYIILHIGIKDLEQYNVLEKEVKAIEAELKKVFIEAGTETDIVKGSSPVFPYVKTSFTIIGDDKDTKKKVEQLKRIIKSRRDKLLDKRLKIETFINSINETDIRLIIHLKYIKGFTWLEVSTHIYGYPSENRARMRLERFLN